MATEQQLYEFLTRIDHPVFSRDLAATTDENSPFNSVMNRLMARQLAKLQAAILSLYANMFPQTADENTIDRWEETYFGFTKIGLPLAQRVEELLVKINSRVRMGVPDVILLAQSIVGKTPIVIRNLYFQGWVLDVSVLDISTVFSGPSQNDDGSEYAVIFTEPVDSGLLKRLDDGLTLIEKGGSRHVLLAPPRFWILDVSTLDVDTILG
ncbi:MAG: hypothetical protein ACXWPM_00080 [Bdellovibrionota bacterium]